MMIVRGRPTHWTFRGTAEIRASRRKRSMFVH